MLNYLKNNRLFVSFVMVTALILSFLSASFYQNDSIYLKSNNYSDKCCYSSHNTVNIDIERTEDASSFLLAKTSLKNRVSSGRSSTAQYIISLLGVFMLSLLFIRYYYCFNHYCDDNTSHSFVVKYIHDKDGQK